MASELRRLVRRERTLTVASALCALGVVFCLALQWLDPRTLLGENVWLKPTKFFASFAVLLFTCAALLAALDRRRGGKTLRILVVAATAVEMACIVLQAARAERSHFNIASTFDETVYRIMGGAIACVTLLLLGMLAPYFRSQPHLGRVLTRSIRAALVVFVLGCLATVPMLIARSHTVGAPDGGPGLPVWGWSTVAGDLRVAHFAGVHALQLLPLLGLCLVRRYGRHSHRAARWATGASVLYALLVVGLWATAMAGHPIVSGGGAS